MTRILLDLDDSYELVKDEMHDNAGLTGGQVRDILVKPFGSDIVQHMPMDTYWARGEAVPPQLYPVCFGKGIVPNGFYANPGMTTFPAAGTAPETCRACAGRGWLNA